MPAAFPQGNRDLAWQLQPRALRASRETRHNTLHSLLVGLDQPGPGPLAAGHDQGLFLPEYRAVNLTGAVIAVQPVVRRRSRAQQNNPQNIQQPGAPSGMANGNNCCFGSAVFVFLIPGMQVDNKVLVSYLMH